MIEFLVKIDNIIALHSASGGCILAFKIGRMPGLGRTWFREICHQNFHQRLLVVHIHLFALLIGATRLMIRSYLLTVICWNAVSNTIWYCYPF